MSLLTPHLKRRTRAIPVLCLLVIAFLTEQVLAGGPAVRLDVTVRDQVWKHWQHRPDEYFRDPFVDLMDKLTYFGDLRIALPCLAISVAIAVGWLRATGHPNPWRPVPVSAAALVVLALVIPAKQVIGRGGPAPFLTPGAWGFFPSGHTATAAICFGTAALVLGMAAPRPVRVLLRIGAGAIVCCTGAGLVWLSFHWLSDVVASVALAVLLLWVLWPYAPADHFGVKIVDNLVRNS